jgi:hypothetical protein
MQTKLHMILNRYLEPSLKPGAVVKIKGWFKHNYALVVSCNSDYWCRVILLDPGDNRQCNFHISQLEEIK